MIGFEAAGPRSWVDPGCVGVGRLPMRSPLPAFPDAASARGPRESSPWFQSLDGEWKFRLCARPEDVTATLVAPETEDAHWDTVRVPGNWTLHGHDRPHYTNIQMPFPEEPPEVPDTNPTGIHRRRVEIPASWEGRRLVLHVGGAESVVYVYVNGRAVGLSKDSRLPSEYDCTEFLRVGANTIALVVVRWSDASHLEDQDHWWMAGLHREVFLTATDTVYLADVHAEATLDEAYRDGILTLRARVGSDAPLPPGWRVRARLETPRGRAAGRAFEAEVSTDRNPYFYQGPVAELSKTFRRPARWTAETPALYRVVLELLDPEGRCREATSLRVGFRRVEIRGGQLQVNGQPIRIRGVNRHDHDPVRGKAVPREAMREDALLMKRFHFNAVRTAHYPNDPYWYELCDELGLYVVDEANLECHAHWARLCGDSRWATAFLDRGKRMVERDKNHACIVLWSLGNESGYGPNHDAMAGWIRGYDPGRPLHYEGAILGDWSGGTRATDVVCPMYAPVEDIVAFAKRRTGDERPLILCEYAHAMGNSSGGLADYFAAFERHPALQGGFLWDWMDQGLETTDTEGRTILGYGGDFGDTPNDRNFCINGMVFPDRTPHPAMWEHRHLAQPVAAHAVDLARGRVALENRQDFTTLKGLRARFEVQVDGRTVESGALPLPELAPNERKTVRVPFHRPATTRGQRALLVLRFFQRAATPWSARGTELAWCELALPAKPARSAARARRTTAPVALEEGDATLQLTTGPLRLRFDRDAGQLASLRFEDRELLVSGPRLQIWRAPTDNDGIRAWRGAGKPLARWLDWGLDALAIETDGMAWSRTRTGGVRITIDQHADTANGGRIDHRHRYALEPDGVLGMQHTLTASPDLDDLPRAGIRLEVDAGLETLTWLGRGPHENYRDRNAGAAFGRYTARVPDTFVPYLLPQENGNHTDTDWAALHDDTVGLLVAGRGFEFSALPYRAEQLSEAWHPPELTPHDATVWSLDARQCGVGTASVGPETPARHRVGPGPHRLALRLEPYRVGRQDPGHLARG